MKGVMTMKVLTLAILTWLAFATVAEAQTRCMYRCSGSVCWVQCD